MSQTAHVNPILLLWARESINMDVSNAAQKIGIKPERLAQFEAGETRPTIRQAREMARVYRRPLACFYLPKAPADLGFSIPHDFRRLPAAGERTLSPQLITELRRIEFLREMALELAEDIPNTPERFAGSVTVNESPDEVAEQATKLLGITMEDRAAWRDPKHYDALNAWKRAIEELGVLVMHLKGVDEEEVGGIAIAEKQFPIIVVNGSSVNFRIFTLIHEFVHLMLGTTGMSDVRPIARARTPDDKVEQFCNRVAAEVLVPRRSLLAQNEIRRTRGCVEWPDEVIENMAHVYSVSREVIARRLLTLGRATQNFYERKRRQYREEAAAIQKTGFITPPTDVIRRLGQPMTQIALNAYHRKSISASELADLLGARLKHLTKIRSLLQYPSMVSGGEG